MVVDQLTESPFYAINMMATPKDLPMLNLETKIQFKLPWRSTNLSSGVDRSKYRNSNTCTTQSVFSNLNSMFPLKVMLKRTNRPGITSSNRGPRGTRGRGAVRGGRPFATFGFRPMRRARFD